MQVVPRHVLDDAVRTGSLIRPFRGVYVLADHAQDPSALWRAALLTTPAAAISCASALQVWGLLPPGGGATHLTAPAAVGHPGRQPGLVVHRRRRATSGVVRLTSGLVVTAPELSLIDAWPELPADDRRALLINRIRDGRLRTTNLRAALDRGTPGRREIQRMVELVEAGCQSELEIWGVAHVFAHPSLPPARAQRPVRLRGRTVYLDRAYDDVLVAVELDGAAFHFRPEQRERDMARDAELAALGWLVLRFSYRRLHADPDGVRAEIARVIATRRGQFARR